MPGLELATAFYTVRLFRIKSENRDVLTHVASLFSVTRFRIFLIFKSSDRSGLVLLDLICLQLLAAGLADD